MGLLDGVLGNVLGSAMNNAGGAGGVQGMLGGLLSQLGGGKSTSNAMLTMAMAMIQQNGGLEGLVAKFRSAGHGPAADSWVGTGENAPVTGSQVTEVLGHSTISEMAGKLGVDPQQAGGALASLLPELVNQLTPNGHIPENSGDLVSQGIDLLKKLGGS